MKAEHRKELETNVLADRMGRFMQDMKHRPQGRSILIWVLVIVAVLAGLGYYMVMQNRQSVDSSLWVQLDDGSNILDLAKKYKNQSQGEIARAQVAWYYIWQEGIRPLPTAKALKAIENIKYGQAIYQELYQEKGSDPVIGPEALYGIALAEETLAVSPLTKDELKDIQKPYAEIARLHVEESLSRAQRTYEELVQKFPESAYAKRAEKRLEELNNEQRRREIISFYNQLHVTVKINIDRGF